MVLALVALVPMSGTVGFGWHLVREAREAEETAAQVDSTALRAAELAELGGALLDEMVWSGIVGVVEELGAPTELLAETLTSDPVEGYAAARQRTDEAVATVDLGDVAAATEAARATNGGLGTVLESYRAALDLVEPVLDAALVQIDATSDPTPTERLGGGVDALGGALRAQRALASQFYGYFATLFDLRDAPVVELQLLIQERGALAAALTDVAAASEDRALQEAVGALRADPLLQSLDASIDDLIRSSIAEGLPPRGAVISLDSIVSNLDGFVAVYEASTHASSVLADIVEDAVRVLLDGTGELAAGADRSLDDAYRLMVVFGLAVAATTGIAAWFLVRPIRELQCLAQAVERSEPVEADLRGPREVRAATIVLQRASQQFQRVTEQLHALAVGALDDPRLDVPAPGGLGTAVQSALGTLRSALAQQDEFRRRLAHEASHDGLTQLPNRNASMAQLTRSLARTTRSDSQLAVLYIDLDRFKDVNDRAGHEVGDAVLVTVARRLVTGVREGDHVGRLGGDEFVVLAEPVSGADEAIALAERLLRLLAEPIDHDAGTVRIGASIGVALADGAELTPDELLRDADLAVYRAKAHGRGGLVVCDEDLRMEMAETADLTHAIRHAIDHDEFVLHYQPIVDTQSGELHALEALIRWRRPGTEGLVPPDRFIGFAERSDLIVDLDRWVARAVAVQLAAWRADGRFLDIPVALNVSPRHLAHPDFVEHVLDPFERHGVDPTALIVEVTENALLDDLPGASQKLQRLRDAGARVSVDDFGTGYTSLSHLRSLPVDILKIDRSLTTSAARDRHEASIVKLIIDTGHLLGATITAEGVETASEVEALTGLGSDNLQGYFFARPRPAEELSGLLTAGVVGPGHPEARPA